MAYGPDIINALLHNFTFVTVFVSWFLAQTIKVIYYWVLDKKFSLWHFFEAGGMPSGEGRAGVEDWGG